MPCRFASDSELYEYEVALLGPSGGLLRSCVTCQCLVSSVSEFVVYKTFQASTTGKPPITPAIATFVITEAGQVASECSGISQSHFVTPGSLAMSIVCFANSLIHPGVRCTFVPGVATKSSGDNAQSIHVSSHSFHVDLSALGRGIDKTGRSP